MSGPSGEPGERKTDGFSQGNSWKNITGKVWCKPPAGRALGRMKMRQGWEGSLGLVSSEGRARRCSENWRTPVVSVSSEVEDVPITRQ